MDGTDGFLVRPAHLYWATFISAIKNRFLSSLEGQEAKNQMDAEKYSGDIEDYIVKMKRLNNLVGMSGVTLRTTIERQLPKDLRRRISLMPSTDLDDEWIQTVIKAGKMEESFLAEEKMLRGEPNKPQERKSFPTKGKDKERATGSSSQGGGGFNQGLPQRFQKPKDFLKLTEAEIEEKNKRLRGLPSDLLRKRRNEKACQRCGSKLHSQWYCPESQPKAAVASAQTPQTIRPQKRKREEPDIKEESAPPSKKKAAAIISMGGRIYELESESMDVDD
jgi:hypothetical protein